MTITDPPKEAGKRVGENAGPEAVAAIDIGTNSIHLVVASLGANGTMQILDTDKVTLRLGQAIGPNNNISEEAIARVVETMRHMKEIAAAYPSNIRAVATHATRVASNHERLLHSIKDATGIEVEVIDGVEEARLSFLGMRYGLNLHQILSMGIDVGGGSTELIIARGEDIRFVTSLKLGAVVLTKKFFGEKSPGKSDIKDLEEYVSDRLAPLEKDVKKLGLERAVVASGTAKALALVVARFRKQDAPRDINGYIISKDDLSKAVDWLCDLKDPQKIREETGLDAARSEIILAGAIIIERLAKHFGLKFIMVSSFGLREGIVVDTVTRQHGVGTSEHEDVRWTGIRDFMGRLQLDESYAQHVAQLALWIFDGTYSLVAKKSEKADGSSRLTARELLKGAALLHEVGRFLSYSRYHRHSAYLIANSSLLGFTQNEKHFMGMIARFHRKGVPTAGSEGMEVLSTKDIERLQILAACLRMAVAMNRTRQGRVKSLLFRADKDVLDIVMQHEMGDYPEVEMHMVHRERSVLEKAFGFRLAFRTEAKS